MNIGLCKICDILNVRLPHDSSSFIHVLYVNKVMTTADIVSYRLNWPKRQFSENSLNLSNAQPACPIYVALSIIYLNKKIWPNRVFDLTVS